jgi:hypothetical protein
MEELFVPYEQALDLKGLGFNEPCFAKYRKKELSKYIFLWDANGFPKDVIAPMYQQAFKWFKKNHGLKFHIREDIWNQWCEVKILSGENYSEDSYPTYEEAELALLKKLIKLISK